MQTAEVENVVVKILRVQEGEQMYNMAHSLRKCQKRMLITASKWKINASSNYVITTLRKRNVSMSSPTFSPEGRAEPKIRRGTEKLRNQNQDISGQLNIFCHLQSIKHVEQKWRRINHFKDNRHSNHFKDNRHSWRKEDRACYDNITWKLETTSHGST